MSDSWQLRKLKDANVILIDCVHKTPKAIDKGMPYIGIPQLKKGHIDFAANPRLISEEDLIEWTKKALPEHNDVILSRRTNPGVIAHVPKNKKFALGQNLVIMRADGTRVFPGYLRWLLSGTEWWQQVDKFLNVGAVFDSLRCRDIPNFELNLPPLPEQKAIAHVLGKLDDKIELNRKTNQTLEAMAQVLFKSWFVDFDPVLDNALTAGNTLPEALQAKAAKRKQVPQHKKLATRNPELAKLFPSSFVFDKTMEQWIPEGWDVNKLGDITSELRRGISPKYIEDGGVLVLNQKCVRNHEVNFDLGRRNDPTKKSIEGRLIQSGDMLVNSTGTGTLGRVANVVSIPEPAVVDSHVTVLRPNNEIVQKHYFNSLVFSLEEKIESMGEGSTGQTELSRARLADLEVLIASFELQTCANTHLQTYYFKRDELSRQSKQLVKLRDTLLPELISGQLRLPKDLVNQFAKEPELMA